MAHRYQMQRRVEFSETDMAGIMHFSNFFRFMEATEHAFFRSLGLTLHGSTDGVVSGWVRVRAECKYERPLHYQDLVEVELLVRAKTARSFVYEFLFTKSSEPEAGVCARGTLEVVHVRREAGQERLRSAPMPEPIAATIEVAPSAPNEG